MKKRGSVGSCNKVETRMGEWAKGACMIPTLKFHDSIENTLESQPKLKIIQPTL